MVQPRKSWLIGSEIVSERKPPSRSGVGSAESVLKNTICADGGGKMGGLRQVLGSCVSGIRSDDFLAGEIV